MEINLRKTKEVYYVFAEILCDCSASYFQI